MINFVYIFDFFNAICQAMKDCDVPAIGISFWDFAVGSFMLASGIAFVRYMLSVKSEEESKGKKK